MTSHFYINHFSLLPHPEGGYYKETFRSEKSFQFEGFEGERSICTSIYFLLEKGQTSALHRIKSDEIWYFHDGHTLEIIEIDSNGNETITRLGKDLSVVPTPRYGSAIADTGIGAAAASSYPVKSRIDRGGIEASAVYRHGDSVWHPPVRSLRNLPAEEVASEQACWLAEAAVNTHQPAEPSTCPA